MNIILKKYISKIGFVGVFSAVLLNSNSCSSRDENVGNESNGKTAGTFLTFNIVGTEEENPTKIAGTGTKGQGGISPVSIAKEEIILTNDFDVVVNAAKVPFYNDQRIIKSAITSVANLNLTAAQAPITTGIKYRLLIYDAATNTLVKNIEATTGTKPSIQVDAGKQYKWYVVSTNDTNTPVVDTATGIVTSSTITNKDVLWNQGTVSAQFGQNNLNIVFKHNTVRIDVDLDIRGMFRTIDNNTSLDLVSGTGSNLSSVIKTGDLNVFTGKYSNLTTLPVTMAAGMVNKTAGGGVAGSVKTAIFYTVSTEAIPLGNLKVKLDRIEMSLQAGYKRVFLNKIIPYSNSAITLVPGNRYTVNARLIESGIKVKGLLWARTNLIYNASFNDKYLFQPENGYAEPYKDTELWNWKAATPTGSPSQNIDPCSRVYPEGLWRMPTGAEFRTLTIPAETGRTQDNGSYVVYNLDAGNEVTGNYSPNSQRLYLSLLGYRTERDWRGNTIVQQATKEAHYWSSSSVSGSEAEYWNLNNHNSTVDWGSGNVYSSNKNEGRIIRCVRSVSTPNN